MSNALVIALKVSLVLFMAGNLLEMGLKLDPRDALRGLRDARFVLLTMIWGFVLGPAIAYAITRVVPLAPPYAMGLILMGMAPSAPFLPMLVGKAKGDLGYTAAFMLLTAAGTVVFMPLAVPLLIPGLAVGPWAIARPLLVMVLLPLATGMVVLRLSQRGATRARPFVKVTTLVATVATAVLCIVVYGKALLGITGSLAVVSQVLFFLPVTAVQPLDGLRPPERPEDRPQRRTGDEESRSCACAPVRAPRGRSAGDRHGRPGPPADGPLRPALHPVVRAVAPGRNLGSAANGRRRMSAPEPTLATDRTVMAAERTLMAWVRTATFLRSQAPRNVGLVFTGIGTVALLGLLLFGSIALNAGPFG